MKNNTCNHDCRHCGHASERYKIVKAWNAAAGRWELASWTTCNLIGYSREDSVLRGIRETGEGCRSWVPVSGPCAEWLHQFTVGFWPRTRGI